MIIILLILNLLRMDSIKDNAISNKMEQYINHGENSQKNKIVKSLPIFIKCNFFTKLNRLKLNNKHFTFYSLNDLNTSIF